MLGHQTFALRGFCVLVACHQQTQGCIQTRVHTPSLPCQRMFAPMEVNVAPTCCISTRATRCLCAHAAHMATSLHTCVEEGGGSLAACRLATAAHLLELLGNVRDQAGSPSKRGYTRHAGFDGYLRPQDVLHVAQRCSNRLPRSPRHFSDAKQLAFQGDGHTADGGTCCKKRADSGRIYPR